MCNTEESMPPETPRLVAILEEAERLKSISALDGRFERLRPDKEVNLEKIFSSAEIEKSWNAVAPELQAFEIPDGTGGVNPGDRRAIFYLARYFAPRSVLEVGTHVGASTVHTAAALQRGRRLPAEEPPNLVSVDVRDVNDPDARPWVEHGTQYSPADMLHRMACDDLVQFVTGRSLNYMAACDGRYDFIFHDGDQVADTVYQEIHAALGLLKNDGLILLHDYFPQLEPLWSDGAIIPGPFLATARLIDEGSQLAVLHLGQLPWPTKLGSNITSLALLARRT
jgi:predicted O-methyltransferase YrrM